MSQSPTTTCSCSQCGRDFPARPSGAGYSHCEDHRQDTVLAAGNHYHTIALSRDGIFVYNIPPQMFWNDARLRVVNRQGAAIVQRERTTWLNLAHHPTGEWEDIQHLGHVDGLTFTFEDHR